MGRRFLFGLVTGALLVLSAGAATKTDVRLLLSADAARPGETVTAGVLLKMPPNWHTYWKNSGDSGGPTTIEWELPTGIKAGEIQWPLPEKLTLEGLTTYVYHDQAMLLVPLTVAGNVPAGRKQVKARVSWLECAEVCIPGKGEFQAAFEVGENSKASTHAPLFETWRKRLPKIDPSLKVLAS